MLPVHDSFIVSGLDLGFLQLAMDQSMEKHSGIRVPIKIKEKDKALPNMNPELAKHWDEYDSYNPAAERHVEPRLTGQFVDGYSAYQERVRRCWILYISLDITHIHAATTQPTYQWVRSDLIG
jgi:hypothetical protein